MWNYVTFSTLVEKVLIPCIIRVYSITNRRLLSQQKNSTDSQSGNPKDGLTVPDPDADQSEDQQQDESQYYGNMQDFFNEFFGY